MKKINKTLALSIIFGCLISCAGLNQKIKERDIPWEVDMGINYLGDRSLVCNFTNKSDYEITYLYLAFTMKPHIKEDKINSFYSYVIDYYDLCYEDQQRLYDEGLEMNSTFYSFNAEDNLKPGQSVEESLNYGIKFIYTMDYYELFRPDLLEIKFIDEDGVECITYYDYINKKYTNR